MKKFAAFAFIALAGCSSSNEVKPDSSGLKVPSPKQAARVRIVEAAPKNPGRTSNISATVCRQAALGAPPSRDDAMLLLKTRALMNGYTAIYDVSVGPVTGSLARECPGGVRARGVGFQMPW